MNYKVALAPELGVSVEEFVAMWNEDVECRNLAQARTESARGTQFGAWGALVALLTNIAYGVAGNAVYDRIKGLFARKQTKVTVTTVRLADGGEVLVVTVVRE